MKLNIYSCRNILYYMVQIVILVQKAIISNKYYYLKYRERNFMKKLHYLCVMASVFSISCASNNKRKKSEYDDFSSQETSKRLDHKGLDSLLTAAQQIKKAALQESLSNVALPVENLMKELLLQKQIAFDSLLYEIENSATESTLKEKQKEVIATYLYVINRDIDRFLNNQSKGEEDYLNNGLSQDPLIVVQRFKEEQQEILQKVMDFQDMLDMCFWHTIYPSSSEDLDRVKQQLEKSNLPEDVKKYFREVVTSRSYDDQLQFSEKNLGNIKNILQKRAKK